jgi:hypothetical protein
MPLARTVQEALCEVTEWNLATLEELRMLKSSSKARVRRQEGICRDMVLAVRRFASLADAERVRCPRLVAILKGEREP